MSVPWFHTVPVCVRSGFSQPGQRSLLKTALGALAGRLKDKGAKMTLEQLIKSASMFQYKLCRPELFSSIEYMGLVHLIDNRMSLFSFQTQLWVPGKLPQYSAESQHSSVSHPTSIVRVRDRREPCCLQRADWSASLKCTCLLSNTLWCNCLIILHSFLSKTFPKPKLGDSQRRQGAREQVQWSTSGTPEVCLATRRVALYSLILVVAQHFD